MVCSMALLSFVQMKVKGQKGISTPGSSKFEPSIYIKYLKVFSLKCTGSGA